LWDHRDPTDPAVLQAVFTASGLRMRLGGFHTYYPQTASLVLAPLGQLDFRALPAWLPGALATGLLAGTALPAGATLRGARALAATALGAGLAASLAITPILVSMGQSNAILVLLTGLGLWALARGRPVVAGGAIGLGIAVKLAPAALLIPALAGRRWRTVGVAVAVPVLAFLSSLLLYAGPWAGSPVGAGAEWFVRGEMQPGWAASESGLVLALWHARWWGPGALAVGFTAWAARARVPDAVPALAALWLAWEGTVLAGSSNPHQAIVLLPALGWLVGWPLAARRPWLALASLALLAAAAGWRHVFTEHGSRSLQWLPVCWTVVLGCGARAMDVLLPLRRP
jgi:hypothetical protein